MQAGERNAEAERAQPAGAQPRRSAALLQRCTQLARRHQAAAAQLFFAAFCTLLLVLPFAPPRLLRPLLAALGAPAADSSLSAGGWLWQPELNLAVAACIAVCMLVERVAQWREEREQAAAAARVRQQE
jgi:hypothetical protein